MGGNDKLASAILNFHWALSDCELQDLGYTGPMTTWTNKRAGKGFIQERVDCLFVMRLGVINFHGKKLSI